MRIVQACASGWQRLPAHCPLPLFLPNHRCTPRLSRTATATAAALPCACVCAQTCWRRSPSSEARPPASSRPSCRTSRPCTPARCVAPHGAPPPAHATCLTCSCTRRVHAYSAVLRPQLWVRQGVGTRHAALSTLCQARRDAFVCVRVCMCTYACLTACCVRV